MSATTAQSFPPLPDELKRLLPVARWENVSGDSGAQTWRSQKFVLKVQARALSLSPHAVSLQTEAAKLRWLGGYLPTARVLAYATDAQHEFLAMPRLSGLPMHHPDALLHALRNADLLARALRELHALPLRECPFNMSLPLRLRSLRQGLEQGQPTPAQVAQFNHFLQTRPPEDLVVTHGDPCLPNILVAGEYVEALLDVGQLGVADRHVDLALACDSLRRNAGEEAAAHFLDRYGRELVSDHKLEYYRALLSFSASSAQPH